MNQIRAVKQLLIVVALLLLTSHNLFAAAKKNHSKKKTNGVELTSEDIEVSYTDRVLSSFVSFYKQGIDEKLYLQTDKPYYSSGERIWFKGYLLNAITHMPLNLSNFIYVELVNDKNELISRVKVKRDEASGFNGYVAMNPALEPGDYTLRGYTRWINNKDEAFSFSKNIKIVSPITRKSGSDSNDRAALKAAKAAEDKAAKEAAAKVEAVKNMDFKVQFMPEGGALLANTPQIIAFKALAEDGLSVDVTGQIFNSKMELMTDIASTHKGMGMFQFNAKKGESYVAIMKSSNGKEVTVTMPPVESAGVALKVSRIADKVYYQILTTDPKLIEGGHVVIHSRGQIISANRAKVEPAGMPLSLLRDGVSSFSIVDANNQVISERLIFKKPAALPQLKFTCSAENFGSRALARYRVSVLDTAGKPVKGEFAVSVTDNNSIELDPAKDNMLSYLLLSSDIKGHIEDPGLYFTENTPEKEYQLDLLMRTQAWRRFDLGEVLAGTTPKPTSFYEDVASIGGSVKGFFGNNANRPRMIVMCSQLNYYDVFDLDESSHFKLVLDIPDSTTYIVRTQGRRGGTALTVNIKPESFPSFSPSIFSRTELADPPTAFVNQSKDKFFYEGGMQTIELESISVTTERTSASNDGLIASQSTSREMLEAMTGMSFTDVLNTIPGLKVATDDEMGTTEVYYKDSSEPIRFIVNGMDEEYTNISHMTSDNIEQIDLFTGADASAFMDAEGGVITITLRDISELQTADLANIAYVTRLGYQHPAKFFQPSYEIASVKSTWPPDFRTTIYWDGAIKPDSYGNINFGFYTADKATTYTVTIEGITESGEVCRGTATMDRTLR